MKCKADRILDEVRLTHEQYVELQNKLEGRFSTSEYTGKPFRVKIRGDSVSFSDSCPMKREEALKMAWWIIHMLEDREQGSSAAVEKIMNDEGSYQ